MGLDFSTFEMIRIIGKGDRGEELTEEEKEFYDETKKQEEEERQRAIRYEQQRPERERQNRRDAIEKMESKFCPLLRKFCIGDNCALMKVLEKPREFGDGGDKHYEAMCAFNIPDKNTRISYDR